MSVKTRRPNLKVTGSSINYRELVSAIGRNAIISNMDIQCGDNALAFALAGSDLTGDMGEEGNEDKKSRKRKASAFGVDTNQVSTVIGKKEIEEEQRKQRKIKARKNAHYWLTCLELLSYQ